MIVSLRHKLSKLSRARPLRRGTDPPRRGRLGFYGYRYRKARRRSVMVARGAVAAALLIATIAAASGQIGP